MVRRAQGGDEAALAALFDRCGAALQARIRRRLSPVLRRRVGDSDVLQQTLLVAARRIGDFEYRGQGSFQAWLLGIADNMAQEAARRHFTRKRNVHADVSQEGGTPEVGAAAATPSHHAMADETRERMLRALAELPEDYRTVIQLLQHRRMTIVEAAELMDRSANAIKKLHARALAALAERLGI